MKTEKENAWNQYLHEILIPPEENLKWLKKGFFAGFEAARLNLSADDSQCVHEWFHGEAQGGFELVCSKCGERK